MPIRPLGGKCPVIHETAFISEMAYIVGDVEIGELASIWPGAVIRSDQGSMVIGARSNVQDNAVLHADADAVIGERVTIGHGVVCHAKEVGAGSLLGNGAVLNDGVVLGEMCLVAAGSVVPENMKAPARSIVRGVPAKVIGSLMKRHEELLMKAHEGYVRRIALYKGLDARDARAGGLICYMRFGADMPMIASTFESATRADDTSLRRASVSGLSSGLSEITRHSS